MPLPLTVPPIRDTEVLDLSVGNQQLRVVHDLGEPGTTPLLLMNGIGARLELLQPFVDQLSLDRPVIRFDVPGVGNSPLNRPYRLKGLTHQLASVVDQLGYPNVDVLGISWGGGLAQQFAHTQRAICRKLVLVATASGALMVPAHPRVLSKMVTHRRYTDPDYMMSIAKDIYGGTMRHDPGDALAALRVQHSGHSNRGYFAQLAAAVGWTSVPFLPRIKSSTLVLAGDDDPLIPVWNGRILAALIPNAELDIYPGGHLALVTEANELAPRIERFLDQS